PMQRQHNSLHEKYHYDEEISAPLNGFMQRLKSVNHPHDNSLQHSTTLDTLRTRQTNAPTPFFDEPHTAISSTRTTPAAPPREIPKSTAVDVIDPVATATAIPV